MLERLASIGIMVAACVVGACGSNQVLLRKVDLLEQQVGDLQKSQGRLSGRIDELQIQVSLLSKKLAARPAAGRAPVSPLPVAARSVARPASHRRPQDSTAGSGAFRGPMREIDPHQVQERLPPRPPPRDARQRRGPRMSLSIEEPGGSDEHKVLGAFQQAAALHNRGEHQRAVSALQAFAQANPEHPYAIEALFLAGRSRMALGETERAQDAFIVLAQHHPGSERAPGALLLAGGCQERLGRNRTARSTYLQLIQSYPLTGEAAEANRRLKALRVR